MPVTRRLVRLPDYDYSQDGAYFVTVRTTQGRCVFGEVTDNTSLLNRLGLLVSQCWSDIPAHFQHVSLDEFVVMPNHLHGIVLLSTADNDWNATNRGGLPGGSRPRLRIPTLADIVGAFKSAVTRRLNELRGTPAARLWQRSYYEHVIRNETALQEVRRYIVENPIKWQLDDDNPKRQYG